MIVQMMVIYLLIGGVFALLALTWALGSRQFGEQERARFLPLRDLSEEELARPSGRRLSRPVAMLVGVLICGLSPVITLLIMVFRGM